MTRSYNEPTARGTEAAAEPTVRGTAAAAEPTVRGTAAAVERTRSITCSPYPGGRSTDTAPDLGQPVVGLAPAGIGVLAGGRGVGTGRRVRTEELHAALLGVQVP